MGNNGHTQKTLTARINETGLKRQYIAEKAGVSRPTLWSWERGEPIKRLDHLIALAKALGCKPVDLHPELME